MQCNLVTVLEGRTAGSYRRRKRIRLLDDQSINQSINLFVQMQNWTRHQGRMQPPLTGAHKNNVSKSNKRQYFAEKNFS